MTRPAADSVKVEWAGTGTGTMSLGSNVAGFASFPASADGLPVSYEIAHQTATERENGLGTYTASGNTLSRDWVSFSTAGAPTKVTFSAGVKHVRLTALASDFVENRSTTDPTSSDGLTAGYVAGRSRWLNTVTSTLWFCVDDSPGSPGAVWVQLGPGASGGHTIQEDGSPLTARAALNFGAGLTAADDPGNSRTTVVLDENYLPSATADFRGVGDETLGDALAGLTQGADAAPTQVTSNSTPFTLTTGARLHSNVEIFSHQTTVDFEVPAAATASSKWLIKSLHNGCIVSVVGNAGSVNGVSGGSARLVNGGIAIVEVHSNSGTAPVVFVRGDVIIPATDTGAKTYNNDDYGKDYRVTSGTQTIQAASGYVVGYYVNIIREVSGTITIDGLDADYTISGPDVVTVLKAGTAMLAVGKAGVVILDAA